MILLSTFPRFTRHTLAAGALAFGVLVSGQFQPAPPPVSQPPVAAQRCPYQRENVEEFGGIGLYVGTDVAHEGRFTALEPLPGYPADRAGVKPDDVIETVDGVSTDGEPAEEVVSRLRGEVGTDVEIGIYRPSTEERFTLTISRALVRCERPAR